MQSNICIHKKERTISQQKNKKFERVYTTLNSWNFSHNAILEALEGPINKKVKLLLSGTEWHIQTHLWDGNHPLFQCNICSSSAIRAHRLIPLYFAQPGRQSCKGSAFSLLLTTWFIQSYKTAIALLSLLPGGKNPSVNPFIFFVKLKMVEGHRAPYQGPDLVHGLQVGNH